MKLIIYIILLCFGMSTNNFGQNYYISKTSDTVNCEFKSIWPYEITIVLNHKESDITSEDSNGFFFNGTFFKARKLLNDTIKDIKYIFLPDIKNDTVIEIEQKSSKVKGPKYSITTNNINTIWAVKYSEAGGHSYMTYNPSFGWTGSGGGSPNVKYVFIENDSLGLKRFSMESDLINKQGREEIRILTEYLYDRPDLQERLQKVKHNTAYGYKLINSILKSYFGTDVFR